MRKYTPNKCTTIERSIVLEYLDGATHSELRRKHKFTSYYRVMEIFSRECTGLEGYLGESPFQEIRNSNTVMKSLFTEMWAEFDSVRPIRVVTLGDTIAATLRLGRKLEWELFDGGEAVTLRDLTELTADKILSFYHIGPVALAFIVTELDRHGLKLSDSP